MKNQNLYNILVATHFLTIKTQNYHWNVVGSDFYQLHKLFDEQYGELSSSIDELAERIRALGEKVLPLEDSKNPFAKTNPNLTAKDMLKDLLASHKQIANLIEKSIDGTDVVTDDILTQRKTFHDKAAWFLSSIIDG
jgi:starvation-inducible DNA-binding protein